MNNYHRNIIYVIFIANRKSQLQYLQRFMLLVNESEIVTNFKYLIPRNATNSESFSHLRWSIWGGGVCFNKMLFKLIHALWLFNIAYATDIMNHSSRELLQ